VKKKILTTLGSIRIGKKALLGAELHGFSYSPKLQELVAFVGQSDVYGHGSEIFEKFLSLIVNAMQIHRITNKHGASIPDAVDGTTMDEMLEELPNDESAYVMLDGSMVLTRGEDWKEVKTVRIFSGADMEAIGEERGRIDKSLYVSHLGEKDAFLAKVEPLVDRLAHLDGRLAFVTDGAVWMGKWICQRYPMATTILDFFHAMENTGKWLAQEYEDKHERSRATEKCRKLLLEGGGGALLVFVGSHKGRKKKQLEGRVALTNYLNNNILRMDYPAYIEAGHGIGSGAIESAQRTVVQKRLKLSGQRWTYEGAQNILNLRTAHMSGEWDKVVSIIKGEKRLSA
jgi:hypothetical protein